MTACTMLNGDRGRFWRKNRKGVKREGGQAGIIVSHFTWVNAVEKDTSNSVKVSGIVLFLLFLTSEVSSPHLIRCGHIFHRNYIFEGIKGKALKKVYMMLW